MEFKGKSLTSLAVTLLLLRYIVITTGRAINMNYQILQAQSRNTIDVVEKVKNSLITKYSINESQITEGITKRDFGVSDCWNYSMAEDERLSDNYVRLKVFKYHAKGLNITIDVVVAIGNLYRAIKEMRQQLGYPRVNTTRNHSHSLTTGTLQEQRILEVTFLSTLEKNLYLMLNDFHQRIPTKA